MNPAPSGSDADIELGRSVGARIRHIRVLKNMTQEELAQRMGTQRPAVSNWENGINIPSLPTLKKMGDIFGVPIRALLETEEERSAEGPMIPLETAIDRPVLERWIRLYERMSDLGEEGRRLVNATLRLFGRLGCVADAPHGRQLFTSLTWMTQQAYEHALALLMHEDRRQTATFLREIAVSANLDDNQSRLARIGQLFVAPSGYGALFEQLRGSRRVVVISGPDHSGKTFLGLKLLMDLAEAGYRPHFRPSAGINTAPSEPRLADLLRDGQAVFLDEPFDGASTSAAAREFVAAPGEAIRRARESDARLIVTTSGDDFARHREFADAAGAYRWALDERYPEGAINRMLVNYSEIYHPDAREPIVISGEGLATAHDIERAFAIASDNRQTIRRRSAAIRRAGIGELLIEDLGALSDPEIAVLAAARIGIPWSLAVGLLESLGIRRIGGDVVRPRELAGALDRWIFGIALGGERFLVFHHPTYGDSLDVLLARETRTHGIITAMVAALAAGGDVRWRLAALRYAGRAGGALGTALGERLMREGADDMIRTIGAVLARRDALGDRSRTELAAAFAMPVSELSIRLGRWLVAFRGVLPADVRERTAWLDTTSSIARLATASDDAPIVSLLDDACMADDPMVRLQAGQLALFRAETVGVETCLRIVARLSRDQASDVADGVRRAVLDELPRLPADYREAALAAMR